LLKPDRINVLLFDIHTAEMEVIRHILVQLGCHVTQVDIEEDCYEKIHKDSYNLMIFDHSISDLYIDDFISRIERIDLYLPIAMMVTLSSSFYEKKYGCSGIDFLLFKPFGLSQMMELVDSAKRLYHRRRTSLFKENKPLNTI